MKNQIKSVFDQLDLSYNELIIDNIHKYYNLLLEWNKKMNLTGITSEDDFLIKHLYDCLLITKVISFDSIQSIVDIGTGAGLPGILLKIIYPEKDFLLMDALKKRIRFLDHVIDQLNLDRIQARHGRAEIYGQDPAYRQAYDLCVSRAVSQLNILAEYCLPLVKPGGLFLPYKGAQGKEETEKAGGVIHLLGGDLQDLKSYELPNNEGTRVFPVIRKKEETPSKYPRKSHKIKKKPL